MLWLNSTCALNTPQMALLEMCQIQDYPTEQLCLLTMRQTVYQPIVIKQVYNNIAS